MNVLSEKEAIALLVKSDGWNHIKKKLVHKMLDLSNIMNFDDPDPAKLMQKVAIAQETVKVLKEWLDEVEGDANLHKAYTQQFTERHYVQFHND